MLGPMGWFGVALCVQAAVGAAPGDGLFRSVAVAREEAGLSAVSRRAELDAVARARAEAIARLPDERRLADRAPLDRDFEAAGLPLPALATERIAVLTGGDPEGRAAEAWRRMPEAWSRALDPDLDGIGVARVEALDGATIVVAILCWDRAAPVAAGDPAMLSDLLFEEIQAVRATHGLVPLARSAKLDAIARAHSESMMRHDFVGHLDPSGQDPGDRVRAAGIRFRRVLENLHANHGAEDPIRVAVRGWLESPGHRSALLDPGRLESGVGTAVDQDGGAWFTQLFVEPAP